MARAPGLGPGYREFESHHSDIFFCRNDLQKTFRKSKKFFAKAKQNELFLCYLGMKIIKIILLTVLLTSCNNTQNTRNYQAFSIAKDLYLQGNSQGALEQLEVLEKKNPQFFLPFNLDGRISMFTGQYERAE